MGAVEEFDETVTVVGRVSVDAFIMSVDASAKNATVVVSIRPSHIRIIFYCFKQKTLNSKLNEEHFLISRFGIIFVA